MNRLAGSRNPYLRQHADQAIHWQPWDDVALAMARDRNRPIFLSVGYATCHWCHVMSHESFDDAEIAEWLNAHFVSIKLDREERPDLDDAFMLAVQLATGRGGWPMTIFLTPEGDPFFAGTYFPREDRGQYPGFRRLVQSISRAWRDQEADLRARAAEFGEVWRDSSELAPTQPPERTVAERVERLKAALREQFDAEHGGFGSAPKFPPHTALAFLLDVEDREMVTATLHAMQAGGIHDRVGGGFHRYSTDREWRLPHFEKMLIDNALLVELLLRADMPKAAHRTLAWLDRELRAPDGTFMSGLDADGEHEEGDTYTWTHEEIRAVLGDAPEFCRAYDIRPEGNFRDEATQQFTGRNVLFGGDDAAFARELEQLFTTRGVRPLPYLDHKRVLHGNGLMLSALVAAGRRADAERLATRWLEIRDAIGGFPHQMIDDVATGDAFADDLAAFGLGLVALSEASDATDSRWHAVAEEIAAQLLRDHFDYESGRFFRAPRGQAFAVQPMTMTDQPGPSVQALCIRFLIALGNEETVMQALAASTAWMEMQPLSTEALHSAALFAERRGWVPRQDLTASLTEFGLEIRPRIGITFFAEPGRPPEMELAYRSPEAISPPDAEWRGDHLFIPRGPQGTRVSLRYRVCDESGCRPWSRADFALYD